MHSDFQLSENDLCRIYAALVSEVHSHFGMTAAGGIFRAAGLLPSGNQQYWTPFLQSIDRQFREFDPEEKLRTIRILAQRLIREEQPEISASVERLLRGHGFIFVEGAFVPANFFDRRELAFVPESSASEISKALGRLAEGDPGGALTSACGAVETAATEVYKGNLAKLESLQQKVMAAIEAGGKLAQLEGQLVALGWSEKDANVLCHNLRGVFNQSAFVMQTLRSHERCARQKAGREFGSV